MRLLIYGGGFDPPHRGHLAVFQMAWRKLKPDQGLIIPSFISPNKPEGHTAGADHRMAMAELCFAKLENVEVSSLEIERGGSSYTVDTLLQLTEKFGSDAEFSLLLGADNLLTLKSWKDWEKLLKLCRFAVIPRAGCELSQLEREILDNAEILDSELYPWSSREIRKNADDRKFVRRAMPKECAEYLIRKKLYT